MYYAHTYIDIVDFIMSIHTNSIVGNCNSAKKIIMVFIPQNAEVKKRHLTPEAGQYSHTHSRSGFHKSTVVKNSVYSNGYSFLLHYFICGGRVGMGCKHKQRKFLTFQSNAYHYGLCHPQLHISVSVYISLQFLLV